MTSDYPFGWYSRTLHVVDRTYQSTGSCIVTKDLGQRKKDCWFPLILPVSFIQPGQLILLTFSVEKIFLKPDMNYKFLFFPFFPWIQWTEHINLLVVV
jgi:hypothetical protein